MIFKTNILPEVSVSNGELVILIHEDWGAIGDGHTIHLGVVGFTQRNNIDLEKIYHCIDH